MCLVLISPKFLSYMHVFGPFFFTYQEKSKMGVGVRVKPLFFFVFSNTHIKQKQIK